VAEGGAGNGIGESKAAALGETGAHVGTAVGVVSGHGIHPAYEQCQSLPGHMVGAHEARGRAEFEGT
jgi:hypothetical protein